MKKMLWGMVIGGIAIGMVHAQEPAAGLKPDPTSEAVGKAAATESRQTDADLTVEGVADRVAKSEAAVLLRIRALQPIVEVYIQNMDEKLGTTPIRDEYFLGQFRWSESQGPQLLPLAPERGKSSRKRATDFRAESGSKTKNTTSSVSTASPARRMRRPPRCFANRWGSMSTAGGPMCAQACGCPLTSTQNKRTSRRERLCRCCEARSAFGPMS